MKKGKEKHHEHIRIVTVTERAQRQLFYKRRRHNRGTERRTKMKHYIFNQEKGNQKIRVFLDDEDGLTYLNFEAETNGIPCGFSLTINALQRELQEYEDKKAEAEEEIDTKEILKNFSKALDNVLKIL